MKKFLKILLCILIVLVVLVCALLLWLSVNELKPEPVEDLEINAAEQSALIQPGQQLDILSWNIGYGGLGEGSDFFMDGGKEVKAADRETVEQYLAGIKAYIETDSPDVLMLQEVDIDSSRSYGINQAQELAFGSWAHALNYSCPFVPFPLPPIGRVNSGLLTSSGYQIDSAQRIALPCPFSWPVSTANLKRCLLVSYLPIEGSDSQLVLVNLHLEAYDDGEGKIAQTKQLREFIEAEYAKGNYVIAGGDFNQIFPGGLERYPNTHPELWQPGQLDESFLPEGWSYAFDESVPSCRLLNQPYAPQDTENTQYYIIDGFIISPNVLIDQVETVDLGFENSDHNPVRLSVRLG